MLFKLNDEVYWTDPQDGIMSGYYFIKKILGRKKYMIMNSLCLTEVSENQLKKGE